MKNLIKFALAAIIAILPLSAMCGVACGEEEIPEATQTAFETQLPAPEATSEPEVAPEETQLPEETQIPAETFAPEATIDPADAENLMSLLSSNRSARIGASWDAAHLGVGDEVKLTAFVTGYDKVEYELIWQASANGSDWVEVARGGANHSYTLSLDNYSWMWRVVVVIYAPAQ